MLNNSVGYTQTITPSAVATTHVISSPIRCSDFVIQALELVGSDTAHFTAKFLMSYQEDMPDFTGSSTGNVDVKDKSTDTPYDGATGVTFAANGTKHIEINADGARWISVIVPYAADNTGKLTITYHLKNNL